MKKETIKLIVILVLVVFGISMVLWGAHIMNHTEVLITDVTVKDALKTGRQAAKSQFTWGIIPLVIGYVLMYFDFKK